MINRGAWVELAKESEYQIQEARRTMEHDAYAYRRIEQQHNRLMNTLHENRPHNDGDEGATAFAVLDTLYTYWEGKPWCALSAVSYPSSKVRLHLDTSRHPDQELESKESS